MTLKNLERDDAVGTLEMRHHDLGRTAEVLGIHRNTLQRMPRSHGLF